MKITLILIGGGGHCKSCIDVVEQDDRYEIVGILDKAELVGTQIFNYQVIGTDDEIPRLSASNHFLVTVGQIYSPDIRMIIYGKLKEISAKIASIVSPRAYLSPHSKIGEGTIIMHGATVNADVTIGNNCIINSHALIEHDTYIHDHCHIATGAIINGGVKIGEQTFIGSRAMCRESITIGAKSFVAGGINLYHSLPEQSRIKPK